jgi:hypothetical protein
MAEQSKRVCNIGRSEFKVAAKPLVADIRAHGDGEKQASVVLSPKTFSTDSYGWYGNGKVTLVVGDKAVDVQVGLTFTIIGSKEMPQDTAKAA